MAKMAKTQFRWEVEIDGSYSNDLTSQMYRFVIINSINNNWPLFYLFFHIDNQDIIENNIYGSQIITVKIYYTTEDGEDIGLPIVYDLIYMESNLDLPPKHDRNENWMQAKEKIRKKVKIQCQSKQATLALTQFVNKLYEEETAMTPLAVVQELMDDRKIEYYIEDEGMNEGTMQQLIVPPMTIVNAIDYIDEKFGIYSGPLFRYADYNGKVRMWDFRKHYEKLKSFGFFTEHKLPLYTKSNALYEYVNNLVATEKDQFLVYDNVKTLHYGNAVMLNNGYQNIFITHPHEDIFHMIKKETPSIITDYGIWHDNDQMKYHACLQHRKMYWHDIKGFELESGYSGEYDDHMMTAWLANIFKDAFAIRFGMYRNVKIPYAEAVGDIMYFKPYAEHENFPGSNYAGAYIVKDSTIIFDKAGRNERTMHDNVSCKAEITAIRTAQSKD